MEIMGTCKYCKREITEGSSVCSYCSEKKKLVRRFVDLCDRIKAAIGYDKMERSAEYGRKADR